MNQKDEATRLAKAVSRSVWAAVEEIERLRAILRRVGDENNGYVRFNDQLHDVKEWVRGVLDRSIT